VRVCTTGNTFFEHVACGKQSRSIHLDITDILLSEYEIAPDILTNDEIDVTMNTTTPFVILTYCFVTVV